MNTGFSLFSLAGKRALVTGAYESLATAPPTTPLRNPENPTFALAAGLNYNYYQGTWTAIPDFTALAVLRTGNTATFDISPTTQADNFGFYFYGYFNAPTDGQYTFFTASDDGSRLYIGNALIVDNDGLHASTEESGTIGLKAGKHFIAVDYFEAAGGNTLAVSFQGPGLAKQLIPAGTLFRKDFSSVSTMRPALATSSAAVSQSAPLDVYPNPANGPATVAYSLDRPGPVRLEVFDALGRRVALLVDEVQPAGAHTATFTAANPTGGLYHAELTTTEGRHQQTLVRQP